MGASLRSALDLLLRPLQFTLYALSGLVPRDPRRWVLGTWGGHRYADNAAAVLEYLTEHPRPGIRTAWITRRRDLAAELSARGHVAHHVWSPAGVWWSLRSGVAIYDSTPHDLNFWLSRGTRRVLLRHGIGMKKVERAIDVPGHRLHHVFHGQGPTALFWRIALPWHLPVPDLVAASSPEHAAQAPAYFGVDPEQVVITGFPRHDRLADLQPADPGAIPTVGPSVPADRPVVLYLPTFREGWRAHRFDWPGLERAAAETGVTLAVKLHVVDARRGVLDLDTLHRSPHLRLVDPTVDPVDLYPHADALVTDYSSAAFDFLLLDRPIVHFVPDHAEFGRQRTLHHPLEELAGGPVCETVDELTVALAAVGAGTSDPARRQALLARFVTHPPGDASRRVVDAIEDLIDRAAAT